tara:strand:- start:973 stop:1776 length:804 start_codon:yes stop_codon:yes gene_type:complete
MSLWRNIKDILLSYYLPQNHFILVSFPKVGRTWLKFMLNKIYADLINDNNQASINLKKQAGNLPVLKDTHDWSEIIIESGYRPDPLKLFKYSKRYFYHRSKVIHLIRDPRDTIVSHFHQVTKRAKNPFVFDSISHFLRDPIYGFSRIIKFYTLWSKNESVPKDYLLIKYENLKHNGIPELRKIVDFLGLENVSDKLLQRVYEESSAEKMRDLEKKEKIDGFNQFGKNINSLKVRKAKIGGYKSELSQEDIEYCENLMKDLPENYQYR